MMNKEMEKHDFRESHGASMQRGQLRLFSKSEEKEQQREKATAFAAENCAAAIFADVALSFGYTRKGPFRAHGMGSKNATIFRVVHDGYFLRQFRASQRRARAILCITPLPAQPMVSTGGSVVRDHQHRAQRACSLRRVSLFHARYAPHHGKPRSSSFCDAGAEM